MKEEEFRKHLKRKGKKAHVIDRNVSLVKQFQTYLKEDRGKVLDTVNSEDIAAYVDMIENVKKESAKGYLYVFLNYFQFKENEELLRFSVKLREERTKRTRSIFSIRNFMDINPDHVKKLAEIGIRNVEQMLEAGKKKQQRKELSDQLGIQEEAILELVKLSDLTRMGYIKTKLSRLYYNSGLDSPEKVAKFEPDKLYEHFKKYVEESGWDGMVPNPKDLVENIKAARSLSKVVED
ncbi:MAG: DUF4332 domain-containing protein [Candidatus Heimdallarchaeota archaeon]|nr:DUF4332 domain-containing protein [Candidatus Heimdallarchaeota archaeon]MCK4770386.1 DUF4332 domain-containing protein [Candidatus Heimdallarchaeota archaeon]